MLDWLCADAGLGILLWSSDWYVGLEFGQLCPFVLSSFLLSHCSNEPPLTRSSSHPATSGRNPAKQPKSDRSMKSVGIDRRFLKLGRKLAALRKQTTWDGGGVTRGVCRSEMKLVQLGSGRADDVQMLRPAPGTEGPLAGATTQHCNRHCK